MRTPGKIAAFAILMVIQTNSTQHYSVMLQWAATYLQPMSKNMSHVWCDWAAESFALTRLECKTFLSRFFCDSLSRGEMEVSSFSLGTHLGSLANLLQESSLALQWLMSDLCDFLTFMRMAYICTYTYTYTVLIHIHIHIQMFVWLPISTQQHAFDCIINCLHATLFGHWVRDTFWNQTRVRTNVCQFFLLSHQDSNRKCLQKTFQKYSKGQIQLK